MFSSRSDVERAGPVILLVFANFWFVNGTQCILCRQKIAVAEHWRASEAPAGSPRVCSTDFGSLWPSGVDNGWVCASITPLSRRIRRNRLVSRSVWTRGRHPPWLRSAWRRQQPAFSVLSLADVRLIDGQSRYRPPSTDGRDTRTRVTFRRLWGCV